MGGDYRPLNVLISGGSGFFGRALIPVLEQEGCIVYQLVRRKVKTPNEIEWHPDAEELNPELLPSTPICINLSGENIADGRWSDQKKKRILESRLKSTRTFATAVSQLSSPPKHFLSASAIGYYGDRGEETLTEKSEHGSGFLADTCMAWEAEVSRLLSEAVPVTFLRFGVILGKNGGALDRMLLPFKLGLGGKLGTGNQWMSWIAMIDAVYAIGHIISNEITGPINMSAPVPVRNSAFTEALAAAVKKPAFFTVPAGLLKLLLGEFADEALLSSTRALPERLIQTGFKFECSTVEDALKTILTTSK